MNTLTKIRTLDLRKPQVVMALDATEDQLKLERMIGMVQEGRWVRGHTVRNMRDGTGRMGHCLIGLVQFS